MNIFQRILTASLVALVSLLIVVQAEAQDFSNWTATSDEKAVVQDSAAQAESGLSAAVKEDVTQAVPDSRNSVAVKRGSDL